MVVTSELSSPCFKALDETAALPAAVFGPVACAEGLFLRQRSAALRRESFVQPFVFIGKSYSNSVCSAVLGEGGPPRRTDGAFVA